LIAYAVYLLLQTAVQRSDVEVHDFFTRVLKWIYSSDRRYNAFPSGHTVSTTILFLTTWPLVRKWWKVFFLIVALSIIASTLLLKQHYVPDVFAGLLVGTVGWWVGKQIAPRFMPNKA
jgi:membrane-associated phospholipid phosphatase